MLENGPPRWMGPPAPKSFSIVTRCGLPRRKPCCNLWDAIVPDGLRSVMREDFRQYGSCTSGLSKILTWKWPPLTNALLACRVLQLVTLILVAVWVLKYLGGVALTPKRVSRLSLNVAFKQTFGAPLQGA